MFTQRNQKPITCIQYQFLHFHSKLFNCFCVILILHSIHSDEFFTPELKEIFISFNYSCKEYLPQSFISCVTLTGSLNILFLFSFFFFFLKIFQFDCHFMKLKKACFLFESLSYPIFVHTQIFSLCLRLFSSA